MANSLRILGYDYVEFYAGSITPYLISISQGSQFGETEKSVGKK